MPVPSSPPSSPSPRLSTAAQFKQIMEKCQAIFETKMKDYGTSWRIMHTYALTDQILIKVERIRTVNMLGEQAVDEPLPLELKGVINYALIALIQLKYGPAPDVQSAASMGHKEALKAYLEEVKSVQELLEAKDHDYGSAWRQMRPASLFDILLMKIVRLKGIEDRLNEHKPKDTTVPAPANLEDCYRDIINYAVFFLISAGELEVSQ